RRELGRRGNRVRLFFRFCARPVRPSMTRLGFLRFRSGGFGVVIRTFLRYGLCFPNRPINAVWPDNVRINDVLCPRAQRCAKETCAKAPNSIAPKHEPKIIHETFGSAIASAAYA